MIKSHVLCQLSYRPLLFSGDKNNQLNLFCKMFFCYSNRTSKNDVITWVFISVLLYERQVRDMAFILTKYLQTAGIYQSLYP